MVRVWSRVVAAAMMTGVVAMVGCKPQVGGKCSQPGAMGRSTDNFSALTCTNGSWTKLPCRGPKGAYQSGSQMYCDDSVASDGDACLPQDNADAACSVDRKSELICSASASGAAVFSTKKQCRGPKQCAITGNEVYCDRSLQSLGDPCEEPGIGVCSEDHKRRLLCQDGKWVPNRFCRGSRGCSTSGREIDCDESVASPNDPCGLSGYACSADGKNELACVGGRFIQHKACKNWCKVLNSNTLDCE